MILPPLYHIPVSRAFYFWRKTEYVCVCVCVFKHCSPNHACVFVLKPIVNFQPFCFHTFSCLTFLILTWLKAHFSNLL